MAKNVFRPMEVVNRDEKVVVKAPQRIQEKPPVVIKKEEVYSGPTVEDLKREAEEFRAQFEQEKEELLSTARKEAEEIVQEAEQRAFEEVKRKTDEAEKLREEAQAEAEAVLETARTEAQEIVAEAERKSEELSRESHQEGFLRGREDGFQEGREEVERLVERLHIILSKAIEKRAEIIQESESQLINLVLLIAKKVIKVISENQKSVVINNVVQAMRKLKTRTDVHIRVNTADLKLTTAHVKDLLRLIENANNITVLEDTSVDRGGCIIETDFGQIDARIASQLNEIEEKILNLMPIRSSGEHEKKRVGT